MNVKILTLVIVLVVSLLCSASAGPMASTEHSKEIEESKAQLRVPSPLVLISMLFLCLGGPCNKGPLLAQPEE
ncbi:hypothetical protein QQF64_007346 [Cirrhinus molitorella]|uniref:Uncharacterized protein n=1 Tax=Cirrhinus molitorella TaxID=172907 RepID=A0ABR3MCP3_9TELE